MDNWAASETTSLNHFSEQSVTWNTFLISCKSSVDMLHVYAMHSIKTVNQMWHLILRHPV